MALDVTVKINLNKPVGKLNYSYPLFVVVEGTSAEAKNYTECKTLEEVVSAGYAATTNAYKAIQILLSQNNAPQKFAIVNCQESDDITTTIENCLKEGWRQLIVVSEGETSYIEATAVKTVSDYIETTDKVYFARVTQSTALTSLTKTNNRTLVVCHSTTTQVCPESAVVGATAGLDAGSFTYKNIILKSVDPVEIADTELESLHTNGAVTIVKKAGDVVTSEGIALSGEYMDIVDSKDFVTNNIQYKVQKVLNNNKKVPYDNNGIAMLESAVLEAMREAYNNGIIATNEDGSPAYTVDFALRSETSASDRAARKYPYGKFSFMLAGAVHTVEVIGEITI